MTTSIAGLHHVTAIGGDPQTNADFYISTLGLRFVKRTVNFDDPTTYHLYYGDEAGRPGTILTFFPWPGASKGRRGSGQTTAIAFAVPPGSLEWWAAWLADRGVETGAMETRFGARVLPFLDPDDLALELVEDSVSSARGAWAGGPVPIDKAVRGFHGVTLTEAGYEQTAALLDGVFGWKAVGEEGNRFRYASGQDAPGATIDLVCAPGLRFGRVAVGSVHHVAFRCDSDADQAAWRSRVAAAGTNVTPVLDREYFRSIYFREPGGVLFEIATDEPGFAIDEPLETLGMALKLPPWLEERREFIEKRLPTLRVPSIEPNP